jgi:hypothetical protein
MVTWRASWRPSLGRPLHRDDKMLHRVLSAIINRENWLALLFAILLVLIILFAIDTAPTWIYQGF